MHLICFSHLRWNFVYQRPQHLLSRFANKYNTFYIEEYTYTDEEDGYSSTLTNAGVTVISPHLKKSSKSNKVENTRRIDIINSFFATQQITHYIFWYYTPMALDFTMHFKPQLIIYDCMDELSAFKFAPTNLKSLEQQLFRLADIVFTGGNTLYQAKKNHHTNIHPFPSSIDKEHFKVARYLVQECIDQEKIPHPRLGFFGVLDERFDIDLIKQAADLQPDWSFIMIGPVVKIDPAALPKNKNIHYLGAKTYQELPAYLSGWDIALIPFAINESTQFISPTKTPEYLAAGKPVISTPITDVVDTYGKNGLVQIVNTANELVARTREELAKKDKSEWLAQVDNYLTHISWDITWAGMNQLIKNELQSKQDKVTEKNATYV